MSNSPIHVKFHNSQNPDAGFDYLSIEEIFRRTYRDHSIDQIHLVEFYMIIFIENGQGSHTIDFTDHTCEKGTVLTVRKDQIHKFIINDELKGSLLLFTDEFLVSYLEKLEGQKSLQLFNEQLGLPKIQLSRDEFEEIAQLVARIKREYFSVNDKHSLGIIRSELHILITKLYRIKSEKEEIIYERKYLTEFIKFQKLLEAHVTQSKSVKAYADMMAVSTKTLNNITKSIVHKSAKEFIDEICIKQIKRLLINTKLPIKEIAYTSGFEESTNFYKYFKHHTQSTPENFREDF